MPGERPECLKIRLASGRKLSLDVPPGPAAAPSPATEEGSFAPNDYQVEILVALEGRALKTDDLAAKTSKDRRSLFTPGGLKGLIAAGWVQHDKRGYFRPDAPPEED